MNKNKQYKSKKILILLLIFLCLIPLGFFLIIEDYNLLKKFIFPPIYLSLTTLPLIYIYLVIRDKINILYLFAIISFTILLFVLIYYLGNENYLLPTIILIHIPIFIWSIAALVNKKQINFTII